jgi:glycosyltransferase involved in cell wall biosynthesis
MLSTKYGALEGYFCRLSEACKRKGYVSFFQYEELPKSVAYLDSLESSGARVITHATHKCLALSTADVANLILSIKPDVIQTHFVNDRVRFVVGIIGRVLRVGKIIAMVHSNLDLKKNSRRRFAFMNYQHVLAVSEAVGKNLVEGGVNPRVVRKHYLGLFGKREPSKQLRFELRREFGIPDEAVVIGCIAFDLPFKGLDVLLGAVSRVVQKYSSVHLILVGVDPYKSSLPDQATKLGLSNNVHWAGIKDDGWRTLNAADVYVQPSRSGEGLSLAIMEAMALKLPVIATRVAGQQEAVVEGKTGYLAEPDSVESLASVVNLLVAQPARWKDLGQAGYLRYIDHFQGENSIQILVEKYFGL